MPNWPKKITLFWMPLESTIAGSQSATIVNAATLSTKLALSEDQMPQGRRPKAFYRILLFPNDYTALSRNGFNRRVGVSIVADGKKG
jgi:hypothetical protein